MKTVITASAAFLLITAQLTIGAPTAEAAASTWLRGANIQSQSSTDFASASFQESLRNLKATGATYVALVVPYYQSSTASSDIGPGYNTPTDAALASGIDYAHSIGLAVAVKVHNEVYSGDWRAYINPSDRNAWFTNFNNELVHVATIAQAHNAEMFVMGTEMVSVTSSRINSDNTQRWVSLINNVRKVFSGKVTYDANSTNNNSDPFEDEKETVGFWSNLDYVSLSVYYNLNTDNSVASLSNQWNYWNNNDIKGFQQRVGKQLLFTEIGYRSVDNAHQAPWNSGMGGGYNPTEQVNTYEALFSYWNNYPYVAGMFIWDWSSNPNAGGQGNTDYTVQNKPALQTVTKWFTNATAPSGGGTTTPPPPTTAPGVNGTVSVNPTTVQSGSSVSVTANLTNSGGAVSGAIVDVEIYNANGVRVFQQFFENQLLGQGQSHSYPVQWNAAAAGTYHVAIGVFNNNWTQNYFWNGGAATITVGVATTAPPSSTPTSGVTNIWWPGSGSTVSGVQPFKAMLEGLDVSQYTMYWQVDGGALNQMDNSTTEYPHKESIVDLSSWKWNANHQYSINFVSKNAQGNVISQKAEIINIP